MAKKAKPPKGVDDLLVSLPKGWPQPPFTMTDSTNVFGGGPIVAARSVGAWIALVNAAAVYPFLTTLVIMDDETALTAKRGRRFTPNDNKDATTGKARQFTQHLEAMKRHGLAEGATPEAIRLLSLHVNLTQEEVDIMANKLATKKAPKKSKAEKAPEVEGGKSNTEALKKARAAKTEAGPDTRKITVLNKENPYRENSKRAEAFDLAKASKTVQDYKDGGGPVKYIARWEGEELIKLS